MTVQLQQISKNFTGKQSLFDGLSLQITPQSRLGLIGRNGTGKSTLLRLIMKHIDPDEGEVIHASGTQVNYLSQEPSITPGLTLIEECRQVFHEVDKLQAEEASILQQFEDPTLDENAIIELAEKLEVTQRALQRLEADQREAKIGRILQGLGFTQEDHNRLSSDFSGGWQMRINLAKVLLEGADILLLDEPTNHLDLEACEWLEDFLKGYQGGMVIVSHDRLLLDTLCTEIAELDRGKLKIWSGNYTKFLEQKALYDEQLQAAADRQAKSLAEQEAFVARFKASASRGTQAKSREKQLEKIERIEAPTADKRRIKLTFPVQKSSGRDVVTLKGISKGFDANPLYQDVNTQLEKGQRVVLLGANGTGKTTLLRLIVGQSEPDAGTVSFGYNVELGYFAQNQLDTLKPDLNSLQTLQEAFPGKEDGELRGVLGQFLLKGDNVFKPIGVLSGGEKSKVALAKLMMRQANFLVLDEPTNHMDIPAKEVITDALKAYEGSLLCISHDRVFIQEVATHVWELYEGELICYEGDYSFYKRKREERRAKVVAEKAKREARAKQAVEEKPANSKKETTLGQRKQLEKQLRSTEKEVVTLEDQIAKLQRDVQEAADNNKFDELQTLTAELENKQAQLDSLNSKWSKLAETLA